MLITDFVHVITEGGKATEAFEEFRQNCEKVRSRRGPRWGAGAARERWRAGGGAARERWRRGWAARERWRAGGGAADAGCDERGTDKI